MVRVVVARNVPRRHATRGAPEHATRRRLVDVQRRGEVRERALPGHVEVPLADPRLQRPALAVGQQLFVVVGSHGRQQLVVAAGLLERAAETFELRARPREVELEPAVLDD